MTMYISPVYKGVYLYIFPVYKCLHLSSLLNVYILPVHLLSMKVYIFPVYEGVHVCVKMQAVSVWGSGDV